MTLLCATLNPGKLVEIRTLLADCGWTIGSMLDRGLTEQASEDASSFSENALLKARALAEQTNEWVIADDSGICINGLQDEPGVQSARWAGPDASDDELLAFALKQAESLSDENRQASFHCAAALVAPDGQEWVFEGRVDGRILREPRGVAKPKLVYDRIFVPDGETRTYAEMAEADKALMSHRAQAFQRVRTFLRILRDVEENSGS